MKRFFTASLLFASLILVLFGITENSKTTFAQVADWCNQPGILWCTSHEEFDVNTNLRSTADIYPTPNSSWYARPASDTSGGAVDRNDNQYTSWPTIEPIRTALPAKIVAVSTSVPARSGEVSGKKYLELNANTVYADANLDTNHQSNNNTNAGIFLSRKVRGLGVDLANIGEGLYFSAWYRFPQVYESTRPGENNNLMVMEFMNERNNGASWQVPWSIHLQKSGSNMYFRVDERSFNLRQTLNADSLIQHTGSSLAIPINKWVHLEVFYKYGQYTVSESMPNNKFRGKSDGGQVIVFQDGIEIYRFDNVATTTQADDDAWVSDRWMVTAYAAADGAAAPTPNPQTSPANFQVLVDDAAISTVRLGAPRELLANGDFSSGTTPWILDNPYSGTANVAVNAGLSISNSSTNNAVTNTNALLLDITGPGQPLYKPSFYQTIAGGIISGTTYTLRFSAKSDVTQPTYVTIQHNSYADPSGNWQNYWSSELITLTPTVQNYVYKFTASATATNVNLLFRAGTYTRKIWLDSVSLVHNDNMLRNGDFADGTPHWILNRPNRASYSTVTNAGLSANWNTTVWIDNVSLSRSQ